MASTMHTFVLVAVQLLSVVLFLSSPIICTENDVYNIEKAAPGQFPYAISLRLVEVGLSLHLCSGTTLSDKYVLTAAQCYELEYPSVSSYRVFVGALTREDGEGHDLKQFIQHPDFNLASFLNNVALIELATPIHFTDKVLSIALDRTVIGEKEKATVIGWPIDTNAEKDEYLHFGNMITESNTVCANQYRLVYSDVDPPLIYIMVNSNILCANASSKYEFQRVDGIGLGDVGSPLVRDNKLIGVATWPRIRHDRVYGFLDRFVRISVYADWIEATLADSNA